MATSALATAFVNIVPGTVELEKYLRGELGKEAEAAGKSSGKKLADSLSQGFKSAGSAMSDIGKKMSLSLTAPLAAIGAKSIQTSADFGVAMASLQVNSGASGKAMEDMRSLAIKMGQDTVFSAGEAAKAMLELSKGGMDPAAISGGALQATMALAATEGMDLAQAATIVTQSMNTFGIEAKDTMTAVDLLAAGAVASTAGVQDLADGMKYVGASASQLGVPMGDAVTALAAMNNAGIDSTTAGTSLNRMLLGLIPTTKKSRDAMKDLGVSFLNQDGSVKSLGEVIEILQDKMSGLTDAERIKALKDMFGVEGMRAASTLLDLNADGWTKLNKQVEKGGVAGELADARMSGLAGAIEQMKGSIDTAFLMVGDRLTPATKAVTGFITNFVNGFAALSPQTQTFIVNLGLVLAAVGPVLIFVGKLTTAIGAIIPVLAKIGPAFTAVKTAMLALNAAMAANPIGVLIVAIGVLVSSLVYFFTQTETGKRAWSAFTKFLGEAWKNFVKFFVDLGRNISEGWQKTVQGVQSIWDKVATFFSQSWTNIKNFFSSALKVITDLFLKWTVIGWIISNWGRIVSFFSDTWNNVIGGFKSALSRIQTAVTNGIGDVIDFFRNLPSRILGALGSLGYKLYSAGRDLIDGLIRGVVSMVGNVGSTIKNIADTAISTFKNVLGIRSPSKVFKEFGKDIGRGLVAGLSGRETDVRGTMKKVTDWITEKFESKDLTAKAAKAAKAIVTRYTKELVKLENAHNQVLADLEKAQDELANRLNEKSSFVAGMASAFGSSLTISNDKVDQLAVVKAQKSVNDAQTKYNELLKDSTASALDLQEARLEITAAEKALADAQAAGNTTATTAAQQLRDRIAKTKELQALTTKLQDMGLDKNLIRQIVEAQAVDFAKSIIAGGRAAVDELNVLASEADKQALQLAEQVGSILYDQGIQFATSVVAELKAQRGEIEAEMLEVAKRFAEDISSRLGKALGNTSVAATSAPAPSSNSSSSSSTATVKDAKSEAQGWYDAAKATYQAVAAQFGSGSKQAKEAMSQSIAAKKNLQAVEKALASTVTAVTGGGSAMPWQFMATGGFVTGPTPAIIGEAGPEVVYPLKDFERMMGLDGNGNGKTLVYYAAPNQSVDSEQALFQAMKRAKVVAGW